MERDPISTPSSRSSSAAEHIARARAILASHRIDPQADVELVRDLAAVELVRLWWRDDFIEEAHAAGRIDDADRFAASVIALRATRAMLDEPKRRYWELEVLASDPDRVLPNGRTVRELMRGHAYREYRREARRALTGLFLMLLELGVEETLASFAAASLCAPRPSFGSPWWPRVVAAFCARLDDPASSPESRLARHPQVPPPAMSRQALHDALLARPDELPHDVREWLIGAGLGDTGMDVVVAWLDERQASMASAPAA